MANTNVEVGLGKFPFMKGAGGLVCRLVDHDGPASYTTGGETIQAAALGFKRIAYIGGGVGSAGGANFIVPFLLGKGMRTSFKLGWNVQATGAEVAAATNLSADSVKLLVVGLP